MYVLQISIFSRYLNKFLLLQPDPSLGHSINHQHSYDAAFNILIMSESDIDIGYGGSQRFNKLSQSMALRDNCCPPSGIFIMPFLWVAG